MISFSYSVIKRPFWGEIAHTHRPPPQGSMESGTSQMAHRWTHMLLESLPADLALSGTFRIGALAVATLSLTLRDEA